MAVSLFHRKEVWWGIQCSRSQFSQVPRQIFVVTCTCNLPLFRNNKVKSDFLWRYWTQSECIWARIELCSRMHWHMLLFLLNSVLPNIHVCVDLRVYSVVLRPLVTYVWSYVNRCTDIWSHLDYSVLTFPWRTNQIYQGNLSQGLKFHFCYTSLRCQLWVVSFLRNRFCISYICVNNNMRLTEWGLPLLYTRAITSSCFAEIVLIFHSRNIIKWLFKTRLSVLI